MMSPIRENRHQARSIQWQPLNRRLLTRSLHRRPPIRHGLDDANDFAFELIYHSVPLACVRRTRLKFLRRPDTKIIIRRARLAKPNARRADIRLVCAEASDDEEHHWPPNRGQLVLHISGIGKIDCLDVGHREMDVCDEWTAIQCTKHNDTSSAVDHNNQIDCRREVCFSLLHCAHPLCGSAFSYSQAWIPLIKTIDFTNRATAIKTLSSPIASEAGAESALRCRPIEARN